MTKKSGRLPLGFKEALEYILDLCCYAYYVKHDTIISDQAFDQVEKLYCKITGKQAAPNRGIETPYGYSQGVVFVYSLLKKNEGGQVENADKKNKEKHDG